MKKMLTITFGKWYTFPAFKNKQILKDSNFNT